MTRVRVLIYLGVGLLHLVVLWFVVVPAGSTSSKVDPQIEVFKLVDVREFVPPPPKPEPEKEPSPEETLEVAPQESAAAHIVETEKTVVETTETAYKAQPLVETTETVYVPQHLITGLPILPREKILENIDYPELAARQGIEGVVYLELFIDAQGRVRRVSVLRDPGHGFAQAAVRAVQGIQVRPATVDGQPVAVRFRYPVRFQLRN